MEFKDKAVVVTGAGGGVGKQLAVQLLARGAAVAAVDVNPAALEKLRSEASGAEGLSLHRADITDREGVVALAAEIGEHHGRIDGLINNAGIIQDFVTVMDMTDEAVERLMKINFYGMMNMTRAFVPYLAERSEAFVANVSSMGGFLPVPGQAVYGASKAAVKIATEGLRLELGLTKIGVSLVLPGGIETDIKKNSGLEDSGKRDNDKKSAGIKPLSPEKAARAILRGVAKNKPKILVGSDAKAMDLLYRLVPQRAGKIIRGVMAKNHGGIFDSAESLVRKIPGRAAGM